MPVSGDLDRRVRLAAFAFLEEQTIRHGEVLPRDILARGFDWQGTRVPFLGPQGIFKPAVLPYIPLSITTAPEVPGKPRPYDDEHRPDGLLRYRYRGTDPSHRDNAGLREAYRSRTPLIYFFGLVPGRYLPVWPVFIEHDDPAELCFHVTVDDRRLYSFAEAEASDRVAESRRAYVTVLTQQRVHQTGFRERVLRAYREQCGICRLRHAELLEAAHILPDKHPRGEPVVTNGIALCRLHHAAFDRNFIGVRPDSVIEVRRDILEEEDGPMLLHGLKGFHGALLHTPAAPRSRPNPEFLRERYALFRQAL